MYPLVFLLQVYSKRNPSQPEGALSVQLEKMFTGFKKKFLLRTKIVSQFWSKQMFFRLFFYFFFTKLSYTINHNQLINQLI